MPTPWERVKGFLANAFLAYLLLYALASWFGFVKQPPQIHEGEQCGPEHHWKYIGNPENPDLSCERDY